MEASVPSLLGDRLTEGEIVTDEVLLGNPESLLHAWVG